MKFDHFVPKDPKGERPPPRRKKKELPPPQSPPPTRRVGKRMGGKVVLEIQSVNQAISTIATAAASMSLRERQDLGIKIIETLRVNTETLNARKYAKNIETKNM